MESSPAPVTALNGSRYLYFAGTGYLGLQGHPEVIEAAREAILRFGVHSATSRTGFGNSQPVREVELRAAEILDGEDALYLASGYAGNLAIAAALDEKVDIVLLDENAHDSLRDASRLLTKLNCAPLVFRHRDAGHLRDLLRMHVRPGERPLVMTDGIFAVRGSLAPIAEYIDVLSEHAGSMLLVDDAHAMGVLGPGGKGSFEHAGVDGTRINQPLDWNVNGGPRLFQTGTLSKGIGGHGGVIAGSRGFLDRVRERSGWYRAASAPAAPVAAATAKCLELVQKHPELRETLVGNVAYLRRGLRGLGIAVEDTPSPIIGITLESSNPSPEINARRMDSIQRHLADQGILIAYSRVYTGAGPSGTLRIAVFANHDASMFDRLMDSMREAMKHVP
ncbi:MAG: pyridoxal phosphate-dependent aminotransferase family protein [Planctomycetota bacterium]